MYRNAYQRGMLTVFFSCGSKPLGIWETHNQDGYITRFLDQDIKSMVLEIGGPNVSTTYMTCPKGKEVLGITMPFLVMIVKNLKKYFSFEVTILDETGTRRRFRVSNFQSTTQIMPMCTVMPIGLSDGWNQIQFNLAEFTRRAYKKQFVEVQRLKINANIRLRRIYFTERLIPEDQLPPEYKLYFPLASKGKGKKGEEATGKENVKPSTSQQTAISGPADVAKSGSKASVKRPSQEGKSKTKIEEVPEPAAEVAPVVEMPAAEAAVEAPAEGEVPAEGGEVPAEGGEPPAEAVGGEESTIPEGTPSEPATAEPSEPATEGEAAPTEAEATEPAPEPAAEAAPEAAPEAAAE